MFLIPLKPRPRPRSRSIQNKKKESQTQNQIQTWISLVLFGHALSPIRNCASHNLKWKSLFFSFPWLGNTHLGGTWTDLCFGSGKRPVNCCPIRSQIWIWIWISVSVSWGLGTRLSDDDYEWDGDRYVRMSHVCMRTYGHWRQSRTFPMTTMSETTVQNFELAWRLRS